MFSSWEVFGEIVPYSYPRLCPPPGRSHLEAINFFLDATVPGSSSIDMRWIDNMIETSTFTTLVSGVTISDTTKRLKYDPQPLPRNNVFSQQYQKRSSSVRMQLATFEKRNFNYDFTLKHVPCEPVADQIVDHFFSVYTKRAPQPCDDLVPSSNLFNLIRWVDTREPSGKRSLLTEITKKSSLYDLMNKFVIMVKSDVKPKLDDSVLTEIVTGQNIVYHKKFVNAVFSHIFQSALEDFKVQLLDKVTLYHGMTANDYASKVSNNLCGRLSDYYCAELDISKFDKSQNAFTKCVELKIYERLGVPSDILELWSSSEYSSSVVSQQGDFKCDIEAQRRSGSATTWFGNTLISMMLVSLSVDVPSLSSCSFSGDDSLLLAEREFDIRTTVLQETYGFQCKPIHDAAPYFCSKYLIDLEQEGMRFVPDPYKLCVKLGADATMDDKERREKFISFLDTTQDYKDERIVNALCMHHNRKYGVNPWVYPAVSAINSVRSNFSQYSRLWRTMEDKAAVRHGVRPAG